jgi:thiol-disulfide isomerase/thioredoxin
MKKPNASIAAACAVAALLTLAAPRPAVAQGIGIDVGTQAPNPTVYTLDGQKTDLARYIGKTPVLIEFWATWCPNCKELRPLMDSLAVAYADRMQFIDVAVSVNESPERVKAFVAKYNIPGVQFFDTDGDASSKFDAPATSFIVVLDKSGKVVYTGLGGKQDLVAAIRKGL